MGHCHDRDPPRAMTPRGLDAPKSDAELRRIHTEQQAGKRNGIMLGPNALVRPDTGVQPTHHAAQGAAAKRAGLTFEEELEQSNASYLGDGLAVMARAFPPVGGPPGRMYFTGQGDVDFVGHGAGIPIAFDAKSKSEAASYKHLARDMHELDFLLNWRAVKSEQAGVSFLLLLDRSIGTLYLVTDLARLRAGKSIQLRTHDRGHTNTVPLVPSLHRTESERTLDAALGRPVWPWLQLAAEYSPEIARAIAATGRP